MDQGTLTCGCMCMYVYAYTHEGPPFKCHPKDFHADDEGDNNRRVGSFSYFEDWHV